MASINLLFIFALFAVTDGVSIVDVEKLVHTHLEQIKTEFDLHVQQLKNENIVLNSELVALKSEVSFLKSKFQSLTPTIPGEDNTDVINIKKATNNDVKLMDTPNSVDYTDPRTSDDEQPGNTSIADHISDGVIPRSNANAESVPFSQIDGNTRTNVQPSDNVNADDNKSNIRHSRVSPIQDHGPRVAFQAEFDNSHLNVTRSQTIKFKTSDLNIANDYNILTGIFTCSQRGLYIFHLTIGLYTNNRGNFYLKRNGQPFGRLFMTGVGFAPSGSTAAIVELETGDAVWVESDAEATLQPNWTYFSGVLLYPKLE